jgi:hypothetical protein
MRIHSPLLLTALALSGCGRPDIRIDNAELENSSLKSQQVGLLEVHRANTGTTFGAPIGETMNESAFCTATILDNGNALRARQIITAHS